jgi:hypothetical protein
MYAERKGWHLESLEVSMRLVGTDALRIERTLVMKGLEESQRLRMAEIAERTPVTKTLRSGCRSTRAWLNAGAFQVGRFQAFPHWLATNPPDAGRKRRALI